MVETTQLSMSAMSEPSTSSQSMLLTSTPTVTMQQKLSRRKVRRDRTRAYRETERLRLQLAAERARTARYKKRADRAKAKALVMNETPRSKTKKMIERAKVPDGVKKALVFHNVMYKSIQEKYVNANGENDKFVVHKMLSSKLLKK